MRSTNKYPVLENIIFSLPHANLALFHCLLSLMWGFPRSFSSPCMSKLSNTYGLQILHLIIAEMIVVTNGIVHKTAETTAD